ncbi:hypothetical protein MHK_004700 [Candidatus Magnetomorum sp. HK-1]|nr:hypothetical protein MHK_004700 [Candidatus Magnetomorum sp. HK-1]
MKLYKISEEIIFDMINSLKIPTIGKQTIVSQIEGFEYPIKVVFDSQPDKKTIISVYPFKRGKKK